MLLYFKYRKFIKIFRYIKNMNNMEQLEWALERKYGKIANESISILKAKGGITEYGFCHKGKNVSNIDALILEYEDKCSAMFWEFVKWTTGTIIAIAGLYIAYLSFVK
mgnify:CR=1 FL=1